MAPVRITAAERKIMDALSVVRFATNDQLCQLLYAPASLTHVREITNRLVEKKLILAEPVWKTWPGESAQIFTLSDRGQQLYPHLPKIHHNHGVSEPHKALFQAHILGLTDLAIAFHRFAKTNPDVRIAEYIHDQILNHRPLWATVQGRPKPVKVVPDAWIHLDVAGENRYVWAELDRAHGTRRGGGVRSGISSACR